ncbi:hypothetical protein GMDG_08470 [Pseudogymnoascus destructans 20631-21]|uniref:Uncharacterized protein n=1 Tax=Pseudogymnoascus destructans (strain ATCC MYA-4855 / 20631-21) TaxID=658429 RepID=L8G2S9_PSED2|nr:hypothetical protein GMDG_08470 [Pseudogymnoascus destructans 20631-21]
MHKEARMGQRNGIGPTNYGNDQSEPWSSDEDDDEDSDSDEDDEETGIAPSSPNDKDGTEGGPGGAGGGVLNFHLLGFTNQRSNRARSRSIGEGMRGGAGITRCGAPPTHGVSKYPKEKEATYLRGTSWC